MDKEPVDIEAMGFPKLIIKEWTPDLSNKVIVDLSIGHPVDIKGRVFQKFIGKEWMPDRFNKVIVSLSKVKPSHKWIKGIFKDRVFILKNTEYSHREISGTMHLQ